jgi:hypothetical protein
MVLIFFFLALSKERTELVIGYWFIVVGRFHLF